MNSQLNYHKSEGLRSEDYLHTDHGCIIFYLLYLFPKEST
uniref:Uncharacterized protein n=1 Tax=Lepeophtheirus salmonis TaxID=72036 RepID=A0A0K2T971_LEPSM